MRQELSDFAFMFELQISNLMVVFEVFTHYLTVLGLTLFLHCYIYSFHLHNF